MPTSVANAVPREGARARAFVDAIEGDRARGADFETFQAMLREANGRMNLVGASTLAEFWRRHVIDSAQLLFFEPEARIWADLGSGAGLPGLVLAILLKGRPNARVHLIESRAKRCGFLREVAETLDLPVIVHNARAEALSLAVEVVTARACAPLARLLGFALPYMERGARGVFLKGRGVDAEVRQAQQQWRFDCRAHESLSDPAGRVLVIRELALA